MNNVRKINIQYMLLHGMYWMLFCLPTAYITVYLLSKGFNSATIGTIVAIGNIIAAAGQLVVGNLSDRYPKLTWKTLILMIGALQGLSLIFLIIFRNTPLVSIIAFPAFMLLIFFQMPLINASVFYYTSNGISINFGSARGMGSITYAIISFIAGHLVVSIGEEVIIYLSVLVLITFMAVTYSMPCTPKATCETNEEDTKHSSNFFSFATKYPSYMLFLVGCILVMAFHNISHTYMIQIMGKVGGDSASMGTAFSIEALMELPIMFGFYKLIQKYSAGNLMIVAVFSFMLKAIAYLVAPSIYVLYLAQSLQMFSYAIFATASVYYANQVMKEQDKVTGQGYMSACFSAGAVLGNFLGGVVLDMSGVTALLIFSVGITLLGACIATIGIKKHERKASDI